jgi:hypothetical protein
MTRFLVTPAAAWVLAVATTAAQAPPPAPPLAETVFKNVQILKGIPVDEFMDAMGMFAASLGYDCVSCHGAAVSTDRSAFSIATPSIQRARQMIVMMNAINRTNFGGQPRVSCFTCHRGQIRPEIVPSLALQYSELVDDPNAMTIPPDRSVVVDDVFARYTAALGGAARLGELRSFTASGIYAGFNTGGGEVPIEIAASAPDRRAQDVRMPDGEARRGYDGRVAWASEPWQPLPLMTLTGGNLAGARLEALLAFPGGLRGAFAQWQAGSTIIDAKPVAILQGRNGAEPPVNFYFDENGLLIRVVRWNPTAVGTVPVQIDFTDYRDVGGVKMPFRSTVTWTDGQSTIALREVRPNAAVDPARFARPSPP